MKHLLFLLVVIMLSSGEVNAQDDLYFTPKKESAAEKAARRDAEKRRMQDAYWCGSSRGVDEYNRHQSRPRSPRQGSFRSSYSAIADSIVGDSTMADVIQFEAGDGTVPEITPNDSATMAKVPPMRGERYGEEGYYPNEEWYDDGDDDFVCSRRLGLYYGYPGYYSPWFYGRYYYPSAYWYYDPWYDPWYYGYAGWYDPWYYGYGWGGWYRPWHYYYGWGGPHYHGGGGYYAGHTGTLARYDRHGGYDRERPSVTGQSGTLRRSGMGAGSYRTNGTSTFGSRRGSTRSTTSFNTQSRSTTSFNPGSRSGSSFGSSRSGGFSGGSRGGFGGGSRGGGGSHGGRR